MLNLISVPRGEIDFGSVSTVRGCYDLVSGKFIEEKGCWYKYPYKNLVWNTEKSWSESNCQPCHIQNTIFQNCVKSLNQGHNVKTKIGLSKKTFHSWSVIDGQEIDVYYGEVK